MPNDLNVSHADLERAAAAGNDAAFALLCGRMVASVKSLRTGEHITVQAKCSRKVGERWQSCTFMEATHVFLDVPGSGDRFRRNDKIGTYYPVGKHAGKLWSDRAADGARVWAALYALSFAAGRTVSPMAEFVLGSHCLHCGRELTHPDSVRRNLGPDCAQKGYEGQHQVKERLSRALPAALPPVAGPERPADTPEPSEARSGAENARERYEDSLRAMVNPESGASAQERREATRELNALHVSRHSDVGAVQGLFEFRPGRSAAEQLRDLETRR